VIYVSGKLGGAAAELRALERNPAAFRRKDKARHPHLYPEPRLDLGRKLLQRGLATAAIDLSDGISIDLAHLCEESGLAALVNREAVPIDPDPRLGTTIEDALHGGEDYELLFTARPNAAIPERLAGVSVHPIGRMTVRAKRVGPLVEIYERHGKRTPLAPRGWEHFR
jgi:thiamine-monophosphate kinase